jgi:hypothetical protein
MCYKPTPYAVPSKIDFPLTSITNSIGFVNFYQNIICFSFIDHTKEDHPCQHIFLIRNCPLDLLRTNKKMKIFSRALNKQQFKTLKNVLLFSIFFCDFYHQYPQKNNKIFKTIEKENTKVK